MPLTVAMQPISPPPTSLPRPVYIGPRWITHVHMILHRTTMCLRRKTLATEKPLVIPTVITANARGRNPELFFLNTTIGISRFRSLNQWIKLSSYSWQYIAVGSLRRTRPWSNVSRSKALKVSLSSRSPRWLHLPRRGGWSCGNYRRLSGHPIGWRASTSAQFDVSLLNRITLSSMKRRMSDSSNSRWHSPHVRRSAVRGAGSRGLRAGSQRGLSAPPWWFVMYIAASSLLS